MSEVINVGVMNVGQSSINMKTSKSLEKNEFFKGFSRFFGFQTLLKRERCL